MASKLDLRTGFAQSFAIHVALKAAQRTNAYKGNSLAGSAAKEVRKKLEAPKSVYGRQLAMIAMMASGVTIKQISRQLRCSRRTAFRYLNNLEDAGVTISLAYGKYRVDKKTVSMFRA